MIHPLIKIGVLCFLISTAFKTAAQEVDTSSILVTVETLERDYYEKPKKAIEKKSIPTIKAKDFFRHHKQLPKTFEGYIIELTTSDFPLSRDYHLFEQFGEVYYERVKDKGYAYLIMANFSSRKSIQQYIDKVVSHKAPEAKLIRYKKGKRVAD